MSFYSGMSLGWNSASSAAFKKLYEIGFSRRGTLPCISAAKACMQSILTQGQRPCCTNSKTTVVSDFFFQLRQ